MQAYIDKIFQSPLIPVLLCLSLGAILLGVILRFACRALTDLPKSAAACFAILFIYVVAICSFGYEAHGNVMLNALPFIGDLSDYNGIYQMLKTDFSAFFLEVVKLFLLAFTVNVLQDLIRFRKTKNVILWYFCQCIVVVAALFINFCVDWLMRRYLPQGFADWLPAVLFALIGIILLLTLLKAIFKAAAFFANPVLGTILSFFSKNWLGRNLTKSFLTTGVLALLVILTDRLGWGFQIANASIAVETFAPVIILLLVIWYLVYLILC